MRLLLWKMAIRASAWVLGNPQDPVLAEWFYKGLSSTSGQIVNQRTALTVSAVYACVKNISETIAGLPLLLKRLKIEGDPPRRRISDAVNHPLYSLLVYAPNEWQTPFDFKQILVEHLLLRGNFYARIRYNSRSQIAALDIIHPDSVEPFWHSYEGITVPAYRCLLDGGGVETLLMGEVLHVRGPLQDDGLMGMSVLEAHRETVGMALAARDYGARFFKNDARPSGVLESPVGLNLDEPGLDRLKEDWQRKHGGPNRHGIAVLEQGMKYTPIGMSNSDAQYLESRQATSVEVAQIFRVPLHKISINTQMTYNNVEHQNREWVTDTLMPVAGRIESSVMRDCLMAKARGRLMVMTNFDWLLRGDIKAQTEAHTKGIQWGYLCPNDVREKRGENSIGEEGDIYISPQNMQPMVALLQANEPEPVDDP